MKKNMGSLDRIVRLLVVLAVAGLIYFQVVSGTLAIVLGVVAVIFALTSFVSFCPIYAMLKLRTNKTADTN